MALGGDGSLGSISFVMPPESPLPSAFLRWQKIWLWGYLINK